ncbi:MAG: transcription elongation factor GreA, partial [Fibrella sp.]|nr:transcription elongation factor GreA [Armatimonadota bacterium]
MEQQDEEIILTPNGRRYIEDELQQLVTVDRHEVADRIRDAKDYGD